MTISISALLTITLLAAASPAPTTPPMHFQPLNPAIMSLCMAAPGAGNVVSIAGLPNFPASSVVFENSTISESALSAGGSSARRGHGVATIAKNADAASPKLFQATLNHTLFPQVKITMRKAGGDQLDFVVYTLINATIIHRIMSKQQEETVTLSYQAIELCHGKSGK